MASYEWLPTESADERYPMQLIAGQLHCGDQLVPVPAGKLVNNGWGEVGSRRLVGTPRKGVPERLALEWFSYTEDQFFAGELELPQAALRELFEAGFREPLTRKVVTWSKIIVGMGLGGWTSVWLAGSGLVREVASAQLEPAQLDWSRVLDNPEVSRASFIDAKLRSRLSDAAFRAHAKHGPPVSTWTKYARRERWRLLVEGVQVPLHVFLRCFNGDRHWYDFARQPPGELDALPKHLDITWLSRGKRKLLTRIVLDEGEVYDAFDKARARAPGATPSLHVDFGARSRVTVSLDSDDGPIPLARAAVELLSLAG